jgi:parafibromin
LNLNFKNYLASFSASKDVKKTSSLLDQISSMNTQTSSIKSSGKKAPVWIIIIPAGSTALLTLHNAKDFLMDSKYISTGEARSRGPKPASLRLEHSGNTFELIDNPARLAPADWSRVLACFTLTSTWQFKGWKWETPLELFQHIVGFHVYFDDVALDQTVASWNVTKLAISRNKRHLDATAVMKFWNLIDEAIKSKGYKK